MRIVTITCGVCDGRGRTEEGLCPSCDGTGYGLVAELRRAVWVDRDGRAVDCVDLADDLGLGGE